MSVSVVRWRDGVGNADLQCTAVGNLGFSMIYPCRRLDTWLRSRYRDCCLDSMRLRGRGSMTRRRSGCLMRSCCRACGKLLRCHLANSRLVERAGVGNGKRLGGSGRIGLGQGLVDTWLGKKI